MTTLLQIVEAAGGLIGMPGNPGWDLAKSIWAKVTHKTWKELYVEAFKKAFQQSKEHLLHTTDRDALEFDAEKLLEHTLSAQVQTTSLSQLTKEEFVKELARMLAQEEQLSIGGQRLSYESQWTSLLEQLIETANAIFRDSIISNEEAFRSTALEELLIQQDKIGDVIKSLATLKIDLSTSATAIEDFRNSLSDYTEVRSIIERGKKNVGTGPINKHEFYNGSEPSWPEMLENADIPRDALVKIIEYVDQNATKPGTVPFGLILGRAGDGKTTLLKRVAIQLVEKGYLVYWHRGTAKGFKAHPFDKLSPSKRIVICIDNIHRSNINHVEAFIKELGENWTHVTIIASARESIWYGVDPMLRRVTSSYQVFSINQLSKVEIGHLLDKLTAENELGELKSLSREEQIAVFQNKAKSQLLVAMLEAKRGQKFIEIVGDELRQIEEHFGTKVAEACYLVSALHTFEIEFPRDLLAQILDVGSLNADILRYTKGFLISPEVGAHGLKTRHAVFASEVFQLDAGRYDRLQTFVEKAISYQYLVMRLLNTIRTRFSKGELELDGIYRIFGNIIFQNDVQKQVTKFLAPVLRKAGRFDEARRLFRIGVEGIPRETSLWTAWAQMEADLENYDEARRLFQQGIDVAPANVQLCYSWAQMEAEAKNYDEARRLFRQGVMILSTYIQIWQSWTRMEAGLENYDEARHLFQQGIDAAPANADLWQNWAMMEAGLENYDEARHLFQQGIDAASANAHLWQNWAMMEAGLENYDEARRLFQKGSDASPANARLWYNWAMMEAGLENYDEARRLFQNGFQSNPSDSELSQWPLMEASLNNYDEARRLFQQGSEINTNNGQLHHNWALMEVDLSNYDEARRLFQLSSQIKASKAIPYHSWALMETDLNNYDEARRLFQLSSEVSQNNGQLYYNWALMEVDLSNYDEARRLFQLGINIILLQLDSTRMPVKVELKNPNIRHPLLQRSLNTTLTRVHLWGAWAQMEAKLKNYDEARRLFQLGIEANPTYEPLKQAWEQMESNLKDSGDSL